MEDFKRLSSNISKKGEPSERTYPTGKGGDIVGWEKRATRGPKDDSSMEGC